MSNLALATSKQPVMLFVIKKSELIVRFLCTSKRFAYAALSLGLFDQVTLATLYIYQYNRSFIFYSPTPDRSGCRLSCLLISPIHGPASQKITPAFVSRHSLQPPIGFPCKDPHSARRRLVGLDQCSYSIYNRQNVKVCQYGSEQ